MTRVCARTHPSPRLSPSRYTTPTALGRPVGGGGGGKSTRRSFRTLAHTPRTEPHYSAECTGGINDRTVGGCGGGRGGGGGGGGGRCLSPTPAPEVARAVTGTCGGWEGGGGGTQHGQNYPAPPVACDRAAETGRRPQSGGGLAPRQSTGRGDLPPPLGHRCAPPHSSAPPHSPGGAGGCRRGGVGVAEETNHGAQRETDRRTALGKVVTHAQPRGGGDVRVDCGSPCTAGPPRAHVHTLARAALLAAASV